MDGIVVESTKTSRGRWWPLGGNVNKTLPKEIIPDVDAFSKFAARIVKFLWHFLFWLVSIVLCEWMCRLVFITILLLSPVNCNSIENALLLQLILVLFLHYSVESIILILIMLVLDNGFNHTILYLIKCPSILNIETSILTLTNLEL